MSVYGIHAGWWDSVENHLAKMDQNDHQAQKDYLEKTLKYFRKTNTGEVADRLCQRLEDKIEICNMMLRK